MSPSNEVDRLRRIARRLQRDARAGKPDTLAMFTRTDRLILADAQHALAIRCGYSSWAALIAQGGPTARVEREYAMPRTKLLLIYHGERAKTDAEPTHRQPTSGPLSDRGVAQASSLAGRLGSGHYGAVDVLASSCKPASIQTAAIIGQALGIAPGQPSCAYCGIHFGDAEGTTVEESFDRYGPNVNFFPNAERPHEFERRVDDALMRVAEQHRGQTIAIAAESPIIRRSLTTFGGMRQYAAQPVKASITAWSIGTDNDPRERRHWQLDGFNQR